MLKWWYIGFLLAHQAIYTSTDQIFDCPNSWVTYSRSCYQFNFYQKKKFDDAEFACQVDGAELLSVHSRDEQQFITKWLKDEDPLRYSWFTSGEIENGEFATVRWEDGTDFSGNPFDWMERTGNTEDSSKHVVYVYDGVNYKWTYGEVGMAGAYICEIDRAEAFRIMMEARGFDYGVPYHDPNNIEMGPVITAEPEDTVVISGVSRAYLECLAKGNPIPDFKWFRGLHKREEITWKVDSRYTVTNGRLTISRPVDELDAGKYQCEVTNKFGSILSRIVSFSFGSIGEFPNDDIIPQVVRAEEGAIFKCPNLHYKPDAVFRWFKNDPWNFISYRNYPHTFVSRNGQLYFSEFTSTDAGLYYCMAILTANTGAKLSIDQTQIMTSKPTPVVVKNNAAAERDPIIHNDFIAIFPKPVLLGQTIRMECLAFGSTPLTYFWTRTKFSLPDRSSFDELNRVLNIRNVTLDDMGTYTCNVKRGQQTTTVRKSVYLKIEAKPTIVYPLKSRHMDIGKELLWRCMVLAIPAAHFTWYKNSRIIRSGEDNVEINGNTMRIKRLLPELHNGMYQCVATNSHGSTYSSAQLRVLEFKPNFWKNPVTAIQMACRGGDTTIMCRPQAAPYPEFTWYKNDIEVSEQQGRISLLKNGNLVLHDIRNSDAGIYTCTAKNSKGVASSSGNLTIVGHSTMTNVPRSTKVLVNETAFLYCQGSVVKYMDHVYKWFFNDKFIDIEKDQHFSMGKLYQQHGLYIRSAQLEHSGIYRCMLETPVDSVNASAALSVLGPPSTAAGLYAESVHGDSRAYRLSWNDGSENGAPVQFYSILAATNYKSTYELLVKDIPARSTFQEAYRQRAVQIGKLRPGLLYSFKVQATNVYGTGPASSPSAYHSVLDDVPEKVPDQVGGGGGSVGTLKMQWTTLSLEDQGGKGIGYNVYWRENVNGPWESTSLKGNVDEYSTLVGRDKFYTKFEVKVQAFNDHGTGPNSSIVSIYSAEDLPIAVPLDIGGYGYNESAIMCTWTPVPNKREILKGKVDGYLIVYWNRWEEDAIVTGVSYPGQVSQGLITGLRYYDSDHFMYVQVYNSAGPGPPSREATITTKGEAPLLYPRIIEVHSHGSSSVRVTWRGITTGNTEEALKGYKIRVWQMNDDIRQARDFLIEREANDGIIYGIRKGIVYNLRVLGYSSGGEGKQSPMVIFTLGGQVPVDLKMSNLLASSKTVRGSVLLISLFFCLTMFIK